MAASGLLPRFNKVFLSHSCSESMIFPSSYNGVLPLHLPKTAILYGTGGCIWKVEMKRMRKDVFLGQGWSKFVEDNILKDGDMLVFAYDGDRSFEVSVFGHGACKETRVKVEEVIEIEEDSSDANTSLEPEFVTPIPNINNNDCPGKSLIVVEDSEEDSDNDPETDDNFEEDSDYDSVDNHPEIEDITMERITAHSRKKGDKNMASSSSAKQTRSRMLKGKPKIKNPEAYLSNPNNIHFETQVKPSRPYELLISALYVKDYGLYFEEHINYVDKYGKLVGKALKWGNRLSISNWNRICCRNKVKKEDRILCELIRNRNVVYEIRVHIVRGKDL